MFKKVILIKNEYFKMFKRSGNQTNVYVTSNKKDAMKFDSFQEAERTKKRIARNIKNRVNKTYEQVLKSISVA